MTLNPEEGHRLHVLSLLERGRASSAPKDGSDPLPPGAPTGVARGGGWTFSLSYDSPARNLRPLSIFPTTAASRESRTIRRSPYMNAGSFRDGSFLALEEPAS